MNHLSYLLGPAQVGVSSEKPTKPSSLLSGSSETAHLKPTNTGEATTGAGKGHVEWL